MITLSGTNKATALITNPTKTSYAFTMTATDDASATVNSATIDTKKSTSEAVFITEIQQFVEDSGSYTASEQHDHRFDGYGNIFNCKFV